MTHYLIVRADGSVRVVKRRPADVPLDEIVYRINIKVPDGWGQVRGDIDIQMPEPPSDVELAEEPRLED